VKFLRNLCAVREKAPTLSGLARARRAAFKILTGLVLCSALAAGCSSEQLLLSLGVVADPNPVTGVADPGGVRWDFRISITNPNPVGVVVEFYHAEISATDSGYVQSLQVVAPSQISNQRIEPGATWSYEANRTSDGHFTRGRERRIYHTRGDDGAYYSGEVVIVLQ